MSKLASKLNKRIMAAVLSVAMVMSNMTVYASELTGPQADNTVDEVTVDAEDTSVTPDDAATSDDNTSTDESAGDVTDASDNGTTDAPDDGTADNGTGDDVQTPDTGEEEPSDADKADEMPVEEDPLENDEEVKDEEEIVAEEPNKLEAEAPNYDYDDTKKVDVWDFGGDGSDDTVNNMLTDADLTTLSTELSDTTKTEAKIEVVTDSASTPQTKDTLTVVKKDSKNIAITKITEDADKIPAIPADPYTADGSKYTGYLTIPAATSAEDTPTTTAAGDKENGYITLSASKGDTITVIAYSENKPNIKFEKNTSGNVTETETPEPTPSDNIITYANENVHVIRLYATDADSVEYKISAEGDLTIARIYRGQEVTLKGSLTGLGDDTENGGGTSGGETEPNADVSEVELIFTPADDSGLTTSDVVKAEITPAGNASSYKATLKNGVKYTASMTGYDVTVETGNDADDTITIIKDTEDTTIALTKTVVPKVPLAAPANVTATNTSTDSEISIEVKWDAVDGADSYKVEITEDGAATSTEVVTKTYTVASGDTSTVDNTDSTSLTPANGKFTVAISDTKLERGKSYTVSVTAQDSTEVKTDSTAATATVTIPAAQGGGEGGGDGDDEETDDTPVLIRDPENVPDGVKSIDISNGLEAGTEYGVDDDPQLLKLSILGTVSITGSKTINDIKYESSIQFGGNAAVAGNTKPDGAIPDSNAFKIEAVKDIKITFVVNEASNKSYYFVDGTDDKKPVTLKSDSILPAEVTAALSAGHTYYFYPQGTKAKIYAINYKEYTGPPVERGNWNDVAAPEITGVEYAQGDNSIKVTVNGVINPKGEGADELKLYMYDEADFEEGLGIAEPQPILTVTSKDETADKTIVEVKPSSSGQYKFKAALSRNDIIGNAIGEPMTGAVNKVTPDYSELVEFTLPLQAPTITTVMNQDAEKGEDGNAKSDGGIITVSWSSVTEADSYKLYVRKSDDENAENAVDPITTDVTSCEVKGLTLDSTVYVSVVAIRGTGESAEYSVESAKESIKIEAEMPKTYVLDAEELQVGKKLSSGTKLGTEDYYTVMLSTIGSNTGSAEVKTASTGTYIEINKYGTSSIDFTVLGDNARVRFTVSSTGSSNASAFGLVDCTTNKMLSGAATTGTFNATQTNVPIDEDEEKKSKSSDADEKASAITGTAYMAKGTDACVIEYKGLHPGLYRFLSPKTGENRGGRVYSITAYDGGEPSERNEWSEEKIDKPIITSVEYTKGSSDINVTASGYIGEDGGDSLMVEMLDAKSNTVVDSAIKAVYSTVSGDGKHTDENIKFTFTPKASGNYKFRAVLIRSGEDKTIAMEDDPNVTTDDWTLNDFVLPLGTPSVVSMTNVKYAGKQEEGDTRKLGSLEVVYTAVDEADYYVIAAFSEKDIIKGDLDVENVYKAFITPAGDDTTPDAQAADPTVASMKIAIIDDSVSTGENRTVTLEGIEAGSCYVTVQAFRKLDGTLNFEAKKVKLTKTKGENDNEIVKEEKTDINIKDDIRKLTDEEYNKLKPKEQAEKDQEVKESPLYPCEFTVGEEKVLYARGVVRSTPYAPSASKYVNAKDDRRWSHATFGSNTSTSTNSYSEATFEEKDAEAGIIPEGKEIGDLKMVTVWSEGGRGKVVPASTDGLSYYYTSINPSVQNFTLTALVHVKSWTYSNGQDGFGLMVSDTVGKNGDDSNFWTNSYQLLASKIQYSWYRANGKAGDPDYVPGYVTSAPGNGTTVMRYEMKLGVGWNSKEGATAADLAKINSGAITAPVNFVTNSGTLEHSAGDMDAFTGSYNAIGNGTNANAIPTSSFENEDDLLTDLRMQIQKYDNAYALRYLKKDAATLNLTEEQAKETQVTIDGKQYYKNDGKWYELIQEQVFSDDNNNKLTQIDKNNIYIGFFAARNARIEVSDIDFRDDERGGKYVVEPESVDPSLTISSDEAANSSNYGLILNANFDGTLTVYKQEFDNVKQDWGAKTAVVTGKTISSGTNYTFTSEVKPGKTKFTCYAKPDANYVPGINKLLSNFNMQDASIEVTYNTFTSSPIYVAPNGDYIGTLKDGTANVYAGSSKDFPTNVYDAVNYAQAGQTIILAGGMYDLTKDKYSIVDEKGVRKAANLLIGKKHDGTAKSYITMKAADDAIDNGTTNNRPVLNFGQSTQENDTAFNIAGNYWRLEGFDVMGSKDGEKGILLGGSHNILSNLRTYLNGNTGIQVARYKNGSRADWPSYNTILNCSSFMNYDAGYEDADGFAAKLTCGDGNKFIGCISAYNADDGWDLFAKVESGSIGVVTLENCLAFKNGYMFGREDYYGEGKDLIYRDPTFQKYNKNTPLVSAGNGNGFKMGGDSMSGYHVLRNSVAFGNKSKGIDSNSCPDIQIYNSISYNNEANNVALYTGAAVNTDYYVENLISVKDSTCGQGGASTVENISMKGTQNKNKVESATNYYWKGSRSENSLGEVFDTSRFGHMSMTTAIFGSKDKAISRDWSDKGSINLHGFLTLESDSNIGVGSSNPDDVIDEGADIYVFAADYCKGSNTLEKINLQSELDKAGYTGYTGYEWDDKAILLAVYAGSSVDFKIVNKETGKEKTVTVNFIQLDGAELQVVSGDDGNGVLDEGEKWIVEAVPVISPAVKPSVKFSNEFSATIKETTKLLTLGSAATGTVNENLNVTAARVEVSGKSGINGNAKLTTTVSLTAGGRTVKKTALLNIAVKSIEGIKFDSVSASDNSLIKWNTEADSDYIEVSDAAATFTMNNLHFTTKDQDGKEIPKDDFGKGVTVKVNDTSVIKVKGKLEETTDKKGVNVTFEVVNKSGDGGTATVTVTSKNDKTLVRNYIVTVSGSEFAWNAGMITIDKAKEVGVQLAAVAPFGRSVSEINSDESKTDSNGQTVVEKGVTVKAVYKGTKVTRTPLSGYNSYFEANEVTTGVYELNTAAPASGQRLKSLPRGTYTVVYQAEVPVNNVAQPEVSQADAPTTEKIEFTPVTIKVIETIPALTLKQTKRVNLFYNNGTTGSTGKLTASSKQAPVTLSVEGSNSYFRLSNNGAGYDIVSINEEPVKVTNGRANYKTARQNARLTLQAHFEGYHSGYDVKRNFTVGLEYRQPRLKVTALDRTIYTAIGMDSADLLIYDPDSEMYLNPDVATIELITDRNVNRKAYSNANKDFTVGNIDGANSGNGVRLTAKSGARGGAVKLSIKYDDWTSQDSVIVSQSVRVAKTTPRATIKPVKLNINKAKFVGREQVAAQILVTGASGYTISGLKLDSTNAKAKAFLKFVDYELSTDVNGNQVLLVSLKEKADDGTEFPSKIANAARGTYRMDGYASGYTYKVEYKLGSVARTANFRISLVSNENLTVAAKGSINIIDRENGTVTLKPRTVNFTSSQVANVRLEGDAANLFVVKNLDKSTGAVTVQAKDTADLKRGSYKVYPVYTFDLGMQGTAEMRTLRPIVIRTKQSNLKISGLKDVLEVKLSSTDTAAQRTITVAPAGAYITSLTQTSGLENFTLTYTGDGVEVAIKNRAGLKEGRTYRITAVINVEGGGSNVKKQVISVPVKVIR